MRKRYILIIIILGAIFIAWWISAHPQIPTNCATWFDGCNTCIVTNGELSECTEMACNYKQTPKCVKYFIQ